MTGCRRLETQKEKHFSRIKALPRCSLFSKTDWGFYSSRRSWSSSDCLDSPFALFSPHVLVLPRLPGDPAKGEWRGGCRSSAPRSQSPSPWPALFATVSDRRRRVWQRGARAPRLPASGRVRLPAAAARLTQSCRGEPAIATSWAKETFVQEEK